MEFGFNSIIAPLFSPIRVTNLLGNFSNLVLLTLLLSIADFSFILEFPAASFPARRNRGFVSGCNFGGDSFHGLTVLEVVGAVRVVVAGEGGGGAVGFGSGAVVNEEE